MKELQCFKCGKVLKTQEDVVDYDLRCSHVKSNIKAKEFFETKIVLCRYCSKTGGVWPDTKAYIVAPKIDVYTVPIDKEGDIN